MKKIQTIYGKNIATRCLGCAINHGELSHYEGTICKWDYFHAHQDIEIKLPGFIILSTHRHVTSIAEFTKEEYMEFGRVVSKIRNAQRLVGIETCHLYQNEDSSDHFHLWFFPVYEWMRHYGKGYSLLSGAMNDLKLKKMEYDITEVNEIIVRLKKVLK